MQMMNKQKIKLQIMVLVLRVHKTIFWKMGENLSAMRKLTQHKSELK